MNGRIGIVLAIGLAGCATARTQTAAPQTAASQTAVATAAPRLALPFLDDDYERAVYDARVSKKPIFVEAWAPW